MKPTSDTSYGHEDESSMMKATETAAYQSVNR